MVSPEIELPSPEPLQREFARDAYVACPNLLSPQLAEAMREKARALIRGHARSIEHKDGEHVLRYRVVTGEVVRHEWPEIFELYESAAMRQWVARVTGSPEIFNSTHVQSAVNINAMGAPGEVYRWHNDAAGFTLLLYLTDASEEDGGMLELRPPGSVDVTAIRPVAGGGVLMDGTRCLHRVSAILRQHDRISIPMVFTAEPDHQRPQGLDDYLYR
jgi:2OG-Fe(II) oxygenase superfamily